MTIKKGINVGNTLDSPAEGDWGWVLEESHFDAIKNAGFDHVRVPIRWSSHASAAEPYNISGAFFERIDWVINCILKRGLTTVINMHHYEELFTDPLSHKERFLKLWEQIACRYMNYPENLYFEILNEPNNALTPQLWNDFHRQAIKRIRKSNPQRWLVIDTALWGSYKGLKYLTIPNDKRLIVSFHFYVTPEFCFQGAPWTEKPYPAGLQWRGRFYQKYKIRKALNYARKWSGKHHHVPLWNGEYCVHKWADMESRVKWTRFVTQEAEKRGMANAIWNFHIADSAGLYDPEKGEWIKPLLEAVLS